MREKSRARKTITPTLLGIKGRGSDTMVYQSQTEKTTVNNTLFGTILKSRKMKNSQLPAQPSSATMDGKNSSFLKTKLKQGLLQKRPTRTFSLKFSQGESHRLLQIFVCLTQQTAFFSLQNTSVKGCFLCRKQRPQQN